MKRYSFIPMILLICICVSSCGGISDHKDLVDYFDEEKYIVRELSDDKVEDFQEKRREEAEMLGMTLNGEIEEVVHIYEGEIVNEDSEWAYIVQFTDEEGADEFENFIAKNRKCKRFGKVLIYGQSSVIDEIPEQE